MHVYDSGLAQVACNDDNCGLQSLVEGVALTAGETYYIIIDGYSSIAGDYVLEVTECPPPCVVECPPGAVQEGEPVCFDGYTDTYNGGCNSTPPVFTSVVCNDTGVTVCGKYGTYTSAAGSSRDTDWYTVVMDAPGVLTACITGEYPSAVGIILPVCPPAETDILDFQTGADCTAICASAALPQGRTESSPRTSDSTASPASATTRSRSTATTARRSASKLPTGRA